MPTLVDEQTRQTITTTRKSRKKYKCIARKTKEAPQPITRFCHDRHIFPSGVKNSRNKLRNKKTGRMRQEDISAISSLSDLGKTAYKIGQIIGLPARSVSYWIRRHRNVKYHPL